MIGRWAAAGLIFLGLARPGLAQDFAAIERGRYLTTVGDCVACHTVPGGVPFAGGRAVETPFGVLVSPNLTPDRATGIGAWSDDSFVRAVTRGVGRNGEHLYPALPYVYYSKVSRADVLDIRTYLATLTPVRNQVTSNQLPFPFNVRASLMAWNALFFRRDQYRPDLGKSAEWNRGAYLVEGLGHCGACHTAKNSLGGDSEKVLQGGVVQGWYAPNITGDERTGLGRWAVDEVVAYLKTGHTERAAASGPMAEVVTYSTSMMDAADLRAIAVYLKSVPGQERSGVSMAKDEPAMVEGAALYEAQCSACHGRDGRGVAGLVPALADAAGVQGGDATSIVRVVLVGAQSVATAGAPTGAAMPAFGWKLTDGQVAAVATYVRNGWGNAASGVGAGEVRRVRGALARAVE